MGCQATEGHAHTNLHCQGVGHPVGGTYSKWRMTSEQTSNSPDGFKLAANHYNAITKPRSTTATAQPEGNDSRTC